MASAQKRETVLTKLPDDRGTGSTEVSEYMSKALMSLTEVNQKKVNCLVSDAM